MRRWVADKVQYFDFWKDFNPTEFFLHLKLVKEQNRRNFVVWSVYPTILKKLLMQAPLIGPLFETKGTRTPPNHASIWWTGENATPPKNHAFDLCISFNQTPADDKNVYFPLFYSELLFPNTDSRNRLGIKLPPPSTLLERRELTTKEAFTCAFINNPEAHRLLALELLVQHGKVDVYGSMTGKPVEGKFETGKSYKFVMCFENSLSPGYITEKLLDAYVCGAVPLYWGDLGNEPHINRKAFINAKDFSSLEEFARYVGNLSDEEYKRIHCEPLLNSLPSADKLFQAIKNL